MQVSFRWHHDRSRLRLKGFLSIQFIQAMVRTPVGCPRSIFLCFCLSYTHTHSNTLSWSLSDRVGRLHYPAVRSMLAMTGSSTGHLTIDIADSTECVCVCVWVINVGVEAMIGMSKWWAEVSKAHSLLPLLTISPIPCYFVFFSPTYSLSHTDIFILFYFISFAYCYQLTAPSTASSWGWVLSDGWTDQSKTCRCYVG